MADRGRRNSKEEERRGIIEENPALAKLFSELEVIEGITALPNGTGQCVFNVYLSDYTGPRRSILRVYRNTAESNVRGYVWWQHSRESKTCQDLWRAVVISPANEDGSKLRSSVGIDVVVRIVKRYAKAVSDRKA